MEAGIFPLKLFQALENTTRLSIFVLLILIGSTALSFTFNATAALVRMLRENK